MKNKFTGKGPEWLMNLKAGDRVWTVSGYQAAIRTITRVTPTQILIDWHGNGSLILRYRRDDGHAIGGGSCILRATSSADCAAWDEKMELDRRNKDEQMREKEEKETLRQKLLNEFRSDSVEVSEESWGNKSERENQWEVTFHKLTEKQVRILAMQIRSEDPFITLAKALNK
jgi:hypothetical protein